MAISGTTVIVSSDEEHALHAGRPLIGSVFRSLFCAGLLLGGATAWAETSNEFWPEFNAFLKVNARARVFLLSTTTRVDSTGGPGETHGLPTDGTIGVHLDYTLVPAMRPQLLEQDWERSRYLWTRVGYQYATNFGGADSGNSFRENRGVFELTARTPPRAGELEWVGRVRWDWRNRNGETFSVYRVKLGVERLFDVQGHAVVPYLTAEAHFDTRYNEWKQIRYQTGVEVGLVGPWRIEPYFEVRNDRISEPTLVRAFGMVLKYYH